MTATNHALTGALIGLSVGHPSALVMALVSHFVLDATPHYSDDNFKISSKGFASLLVIEAVCCFLIVVILALRQPVHWQLAAVCAFLATSPDFMWIPRFIRARKGLKEPKPTNAIVRFHTWIQWKAIPKGALVEAIWAIACAAILAKLV